MSSISAHRFTVDKPVVAILLLILSWLLLAAWFNEFEIYTFVPYDDVWEEGRPLPGTWQRQLNDFLESPPWRYLPAWLIVGTSIALFAIALRRSLQSPLGIIQKVSRLGLGFAFLNFLLIAGLFFTPWVADLLLKSEIQQALEAQYGLYGRSFCHLFTEILFCIAPWLVLQWGIPKLMLTRSRHEGMG